MLPSKEVLLETPLHLLRNAYTSQIDSPEEEALLQEVINLKQQNNPVPLRTGTHVVPVEPLEPNDKEIGRGTLERISPMGQVEPVLKTEPKVFCQFCDSKGVRHKLSCTRPDKAVK